MPKTLSETSMNSTPATRKGGHGAHRSQAANPKVVCDNQSIVASSSTSDMLGLILESIERIAIEAHVLVERAMNEREHYAATKHLGESACATRSARPASEETDGLPSVQLPNCASAQPGGMSWQMVHSTFRSNSASADEIQSMVRVLLNVQVSAGSARGGAAALACTPEKRTDVAVTERIEQQIQMMQRLIRKFGVQRAGRQGTT